MEPKNTLLATWKGSEFRDTFAPYTGKQKSPKKNERETPALWDICDGCVLWLPLSYNRDKNSGPLVPPKGVLDHPILVLHVAVSGPEDAVVTFATMRSFKDEGPDESHPQFWKRYLKIVPENPAATSSSDENSLYIDKPRGKGSMKKNSYVDLSAVYIAKWEELQCYAVGQKPDAYRHRLNQESFLKLFGRMESKLTVQSQMWVKTDQLWEAFKRVHIDSRYRVGLVEPVVKPRENDDTERDWN